MILRREKKEMGIEEKQTNKNTSTLHLWSNELLFII